MALFILPYPPRTLTRKRPPHGSGLNTNVTASGKRRDPAPLPHCLFHTDDSVHSCLNAYLISWRKLGPLHSVALAGRKNHLRWKKGIFLTHTRKVTLITVGKRRRRTGKCIQTWRRASLSREAIPIPGPRSPELLPLDPAHTQKVRGPLGCFHLHLNLDLMTSCPHPNTVEKAIHLRKFPIRNKLVLFRMF